MCQDGSVMGCADRGCMSAEACWKDDEVAGQNRWSISRAAVVITALTAISTLLGFVRDVVIASVFGAGPELDAFLVAQGLMTLLLGLIATAVAKSVTPTVAREVAEERTDPGRCVGHRSFDTALTVTLVVLGVSAMLLGLLAGPVTSVIAPGFSDDQAELTAGLTRVMLVATVLIAGTNLIAALVQAHGRFVWSALEGVPFNLTMITAAALFGPDHGVKALAVGFVVGSALRLLIQLPPVRRLRIGLRARLDLRDQGFQEIARLVPAMLVGTAIVNVNTMVDRAVGSTVGDGAITALSFGWRLIHLPETLIITALLVPLYPALGAAVRHQDELRRLVGRGLDVSLTVLTPVAIVLAVTAVPLVTLVFGRGAFDGHAVMLTATALAWYAPGLVALGCRAIVVKASYSIGDPRAPMVVAVVAMVVNVVGDIVLAPIMGVAGIALATTASLVLAAVVNLMLLHRRHQAVDIRAVGGLVSRTAALALVSGTAGVLLAAWTQGMAPAAAILLTAGVVSVVFYGGVILLRGPERAVLSDVWRIARRRR